MSARKAMQERIFRSLWEEGPLPRLPVAERATKDGDIPRALRIVRDLIEADELDVLEDGLITLSPKGAHGPLSPFEEFLCKMDEGRHEGQQGQDKDT